jgi:fibronectin type 3 domain-containing protein
VSGADGYNIYRSTFSRVGFAKITSSPVEAADFTDRALRADTAYYYIVTAVWPGGLESNFSREVESPAELPRYEQAQPDRDNSPAIWRWK